jgi:hypothetical protein|tara:strand:+ start:640 stop:810 length:171 start_codon:yes stop_codon:yes gene_type:complete
MGCVGLAGNNDVCADVWVTVKVRVRVRVRVRIRVRARVGVTCYLHATDTHERLGLP